MRSYLLLFLGIILINCLAHTAEAQVEKGRYTIGGNIDISGTRTGIERTFRMTVAPQFGVFVVKGFAVGARYSFGVAGSRTYNEDKKEFEVSTTYTTNIGPRLKYYYGKKQMKGYIMGHGGYSVATRVRKGNVFNRNGFTFGASLGMAYFVNNNIAIESGLYFDTSGYEKTLPTTRIGFSVGIFTFLDNKKKE